MLMFAARQNMLLGATRCRRADTCDFSLPAAVLTCTAEFRLPP